MIRGLVKVRLSATVAQKPTEGKYDRIATRALPQFFKRKPEFRMGSNELVSGKSWRG